MKRTNVVKAGFVQMKCVFGQVHHNLSRARQLVEPVDADLLVLPELFNTGYLFRDRTESASFAESVPDGPTTQFLLQLAHEKNCFIVAGLAEKSGSQVFNSCVLVGPDGFVDVYRKVHLFLNEKDWFDPGDKPFAVVDIGIAKIGMMICFDWIFPESMRSLALQGAELVCHPSNLVMPYCQDAMVTRCLENLVYAVTANRIGIDERDFASTEFTGGSQITAPRGTILTKAPRDQECVSVIELDLTTRDKRLNPKNDLFADRRPNLYSLS